MPEEVDRHGNLLGEPMRVALRLLTQLTFPEVDGKKALPAEIRVSRLRVVDRRDGCATLMMYAWTEMPSTRTDRVTLSIHVPSISELDLGMFLGQRHDPPESILLVRERLIVIDGIIDP
jgi:hypothetical protein